MPSWRVEPERLEQTWQAYRQVAPNWPPLFHAAGAATPTQPDGRWHRNGEGYAQYFALEPMGAWAELVRFEGIRDTARADSYRRVLWIASVQEADIADLSTWDRYERCGLDPLLAIGPHTDSQELADELRSAGYRGLLSPSAALPGATNLTLFGERYESVLAGGFSSYVNPKPGVFVPCTKAALGSPPAELTTTTVFARAPHPGYEAWNRAKGGPPAPASTP